ncbi:hypothetical protein FB45DRAFT_880847 [Roridomyces roridus]|uniref:Uncharacterized protein n=1 Tax=Roridomyces roridus TaxID=1738132 RepID=A0AAD7AYE6_9AGAR|nr:hypothetical protein FB45DRAFT_880847 [Roridomyces roridus]
MSFIGAIKKSDVKEAAPILYNWHVANDFGEDLVWKPSSYAHISASSPHWHGVCGQEANDGHQRMIRSYSQVSPLSHASSLLPQEIWDEIVDQLAAGDFHETKELKSLCLAGRCFVSRAQFHIFHSIWISYHPPTAVVTGVRAQRLLNVMTSESSPHLIPYVQDLHIYAGDAKSFHSVAQIPWSNVLQLTLFTVEAASGSSLLQDVAKLVGLPSLRGLVFCTGCWDATHLCNIFPTAPCLATPFVPPATPVTFARPEYISFTTFNDIIMDLLLEPNWISPASLGSRLLNSTAPGSTPFWVASAQLSLGCIFAATIFFGDGGAAEGEGGRGKVLEVLEGGFVDVRTALQEVLADGRGVMRRRGSQIMCHSAVTRISSAFAGSSVLHSCSALRLRLGIKLNLRATTDILWGWRSSGRFNFPNR